MGPAEFRNVTQQLFEAKAMIEPFMDRNANNSLWKQLLSTAGRPDFNQASRLSFWLMAVLMHKLTPDERAELFISTSTTRRLDRLLARFEASPPIVERAQSNLLPLRDNNTEQLRALAHQGGFRRIQPSSSTDSLSALCLLKSEEWLDSLGSGLTELPTGLLQAILDSYTTRYLIQEPLLEQLVRCPQLERLKLIGDHITDELLLHQLSLATFDNLQELYLWNAYKLQSPTIVPLLQRFTQLTTLSLDRCKRLGDDVVIPLLASLPELSTVALQGTRITAQALRALSQHTRKLTSLNASSILFLDDKLATELLGPTSVFYPNLHTLFMDGVRISHASAVHLTAHTNLHTLSLGFNTRISDWTFIQSLPQLRDLTVNLNARLDGEAFAPLCTSLQGLTYLDASRAGLDDDALLGLQSLTQLRVLNLGHTDIGNGVGTALRNMPMLTAVLLPYTRVTGALAMDLSTLQYLRVLKLTGCAFDDAGIGALATGEYLPVTLESLDIGGNGITDAVEPHVLQLHKLQSLQLWETAVSPPCAQRLVAGTPMVLDDQIRCATGTWMLIVPDRLK
eukprot:m.110485 g.110485  ORF g.110485 m.110485 type:complete len:566 (-) comp15366_c0_seq2:47-1744(-)